jgi:GNAT superfamily N-acetyltransferase
VDRQAKSEEAFLAPLGSALLSRDTQIIERDGWYQTITPSSRTTQGNEVVYSRIAARDADAVVDATVAQYRAAGVPFKWCVGPLTEPAGFGDVLTARGFTSWAVRGMAIDVPSRAAWMERSIDPSIAIEVVTQASLRAYHDAWSRGWETPVADVDAWCDDHVRAIATGRFHFYLARVDGEVAGTAGFIVKPRCAYLVGGNVLPAFRGRGVYRALLATRLAAIAECGLTLAVTQAREATSAPILEGFGFESLYQSFIYRWQP